MVDYDLTALDGAVDKSSTTITNVSDICDACSSLSNMDYRIKEKYSVQSIIDAGKALDNIQGNATSFNEWLSSTVSDLRQTKQRTEDIAGGKGDVTGDSSLGDSSVGEGSAAAAAIAAISDVLADIQLGDSDNPESIYTIDAEAWASLDGETKDAIVRKLKELGFTDEEIKAIQEGKANVDKVKLNELSSKLEELYKTDPSIRQKIIDLYGFDIFNDDGTVNKDLLALVMIMDNKNPNDAYDLSKLLTELAKVDSSTNTSSTPAMSGTTKISDATTSVANTETGTGTKTGTGLGALSGASSEGVEGGLAASLEGAANSTSKSGLGQEISKFMSGIKPTSGEITTNGASAVALAAGGLAAAGVAGGGGVAIGKKTMNIKFTPEDFESLPEFIQTVVLSDFKIVNFTKEETELFQKSTFKVKSSEIDKLIKSIRKAISLDPSTENKLTDFYKFSIFTQEGKIDKYLLFLIMLIDGKALTDDVSIYNVLNPILIEADEADYVYTGLSMEDVIDKPKEKNKEEIEEFIPQEQVQANQEEQIGNVNTTKEWLQDLGLDEY